MPSNPKTLGEHLKRRRLQLHLMQADLAYRLGVHLESLKNWERGVTNPIIRYIPRILEFLGYDPESEPTLTSQRLIHVRRRLGLTQKAFAKLISTDAVTLYRWENNLSVPPQKTLRRIEHLFH